jgi:hypothetical protein
MIGGCGINAAHAHAMPIPPSMAEIRIFDIERICESHLAKNHSAKHLIQSALTSLALARKSFPIYFPYYIADFGRAKCFAPGVL